MWVIVSSTTILGEIIYGIKLLGMGYPYFTMKNCIVQIRHMQLNILTWNIRIGPQYYFVGLKSEVIINRDSWGYFYCAVRGEILGSAQDKLLQKNLPRMFLLIKNESWGIKDY